MKVLHLNGYFLLPDNFKGTEADAIELLARYHRKKMKSKSVVHIKTKQARSVRVRQHVDPWRGFLAVINKGYRLYFEIFCGEVKYRKAQRARR